MTINARTAIATAHRNYALGFLTAEECAVQIRNILRGCY